MVDINSINNILIHFKGNIECISFTQFKSGHINNTYLITTTTNNKYVLQKINTNVFKNITAVIKNKQLLNTFFKTQTNALNYEYVHFLETKTNTIAFKDEYNNYWNIMHYIKDSQTFEVALNKDVVFEAGKLYGNFISQTATIDALKFSEIIKDFHSVPFRLQQFNNALKATKINTVLVEDLISATLKHKQELSKLWQLKAKGLLPLRLTHNDTKLSNILFNSNKKGLAVIDLDTVMPGIIHFDFGDSIRSICATTKEDETDLNLVKINLEFYKEYCKGFSVYTKTILSKKEITYLPLAIKTMIYIMAVRFFTDYLNGNIYYKVNYPKHNLVRAKNQFKLLEDVSNKFNEIKNITAYYFSK